VIIEFKQNNLNKEDIDQDIALLTITLYVLEWMIHSSISNLAKSPVYSGKLNRLEDKIISAL
jgi:hypothetical protein